MELQEKVAKLENSHSEQAIEKQNEISMDIRLLRQSFDSNKSAELESKKRQNARIESLEGNQSKLTWAVLFAIIGAVMASVLVKA
jgi:hypothetical protein